MLLQNTKIDKSLTISWYLELDDGSKIFDSNNRSKSQWLLLKEEWGNLNKKIVQMGLFNINNAIDENNIAGARTPKNKKGYCFLRKAMAMFGGPSIDLWGLGYLNDDNKIVTILWYNDGMSLVEREERSKEKCLLGLIENKS